MFLTNTFLIPYMAIRLNDLDDDDGERSRPKPSRLGSLMTDGARAVGAVGGIVCLVSILWALLGRPGAEFGDVVDRWRFLEGYLRSERLAYAFVWDIFLYAIFQPWLIGDNLGNVKRGCEGLVGALRFVPAFGLVAYLLCLDGDRDL